MKKHLDLPFDQYTRQLLATEIINSIRKPDEVFSILDVGGYKGKTAAFLPQDNVTVLDVFDIDEENYIKGDGSRLDLDDNSFDFVCSFDVLEHIPRPLREAYVNESLRVARKGMVLACPFNSSQGSAAVYEKTLNQIFLDINGEEHPWLREHIQYGLPEEGEIEELLQNHKYNKGYSNLLDEWALMQEGIFMASALEAPSFDVGKLNRYYNRNAKELELGITSNNAYRVIYFISKDADYSSKVRKILESSNKSIDALSHIKLKKEIMLTLSKIYSQNHSSKETQIRHLTKQVEEKTTKLHAIESSHSWRLTKPMRILKDKIS